MKELKSTVRKPARRFSKEFKRRLFIHGSPDRVVLQSVIEALR